MAEFSSRLPVLLLISAVVGAELSPENLIKLPKRGNVCFIRPQMCNPGGREKLKGYRTLRDLPVVLGALKALCVVRANLKYPDANAETIGRICGEKEIRRLIVEKKLNKGHLHEIFQRNGIQP